MVWLTYVNRRHTSSEPTSQMMLTGLNQKVRGLVRERLPKPVVDETATGE